MNSENAPNRHNRPKMRFFLSIRYGTGSQQPRPHGWQRSKRFAIKKHAVGRWYFPKHPSAYSEQVGRKRHSHCKPKVILNAYCNGDRKFLYTRTATHSQNVKNRSAEHNANIGNARNQRRTSNDRYATAPFFMYIRLFSVSSAFLPALRKQNQPSSLWIQHHTPANPCRTHHTRSNKSQKFLHTTVLSFIFKRSINRIRLNPRLL